MRLETVKSTVRPFRLVCVGEDDVWVWGEGGDHLPSGWTGDSSMAQNAARQ